MKDYVVVVVVTSAFMIRFAFDVFVVVSHHNRGKSYQQEDTLTRDVLYADR